MVFRVSTLAAALTFVNAILLNGSHYRATSALLATLCSAAPLSEFSEIATDTPAAIILDSSASLRCGSRAIVTHGTTTSSTTTPSDNPTELFLPYTNAVHNGPSYRSSGSCKRSTKEQKKSLLDDDNDTRTAIEGEDAGMYTGMTAEQLMSSVRAQPNYHEFVTRLDLGILGALIFYPIPGQKEVSDAAIKRAIQRAEPMKARDMEYHRDEGVVFRVRASGTLWRVSWEPYFDKRSPMGGGNSDEMLLE